MLNFTNMERAGLLPVMLSEHDPAPAATQLDIAYAHGGGWRPFPGFKLTGKGPRVMDARIKYPGDPALREVSRAVLRDELIILFECAWVAVVQPDGTYVIARMD